MCCEASTQLSPFQAWLADIIQHQVVSRALIFQVQNCPLQIDFGNDLCVCVLWFVPSNHWMLYMFCMRRIAFVTYSCVAEQFKLHRDVYLYTVFGCIHASLQQFSLCFSNVMCEWGYIGRFTGTCLYIVCNVCIYIAKVVSSIHRNNFILLTITWLVVIYKNRQYIRVHVTHVAE